MIAKLKGIVDSFGEDWLIVDVGGVGYMVHVSTRTLANLANVGEAVELLIDPYIREDKFDLFGFQTAQEKDLFRLLQTVQG